MILLQVYIICNVDCVSVAGSLQRFEVPQKIVLTEEVWTPDTGLVTDSLKLKRKPLTDHYQAVVEQMYR